MSTSCVSKINQHVYTGSHTSMDDTTEMNMLKADVWVINENVQYVWKAKPQ